MDEKIGIAYLYLNFKSHHEQTVEALLSSLLRQLASSPAPLPDSVRDLYTRCKDKRKRPTLDEISNSIEIVASLYSRVFFIVDALNECQASGGCPREFLSQIFILQRRCAGNVLATSRFIPEIVDMFKGRMILEIRASEHDIERYVEANLELLPAFVRRNTKIQEDIKISISNIVDGM
jgi:hypothetical protein